MFLVAPGIGHSVGRCQMSTSRGRFTHFFRERSLLNKRKAGRAEYVGNRLKVGTYIEYFHYLDKT